jgi:hypothetical protein
VSEDHQQDPTYPVESAPGLAWSSSPGEPREVHRTEAGTWLWGVEGKIGVRSRCTRGH